MLAGNLTSFVGADPGHECALPNSSAVNKSLPAMYTDGQCNILVDEGGVNVSKPCPYGYFYGDQFESTILSQVSYFLASLFREVYQLLSG